MSRSGSLLEALAHYLEALECTPPGYERYAAFEPADEALRELEPYDCSSAGETDGSNGCRRHRKVQHGCGRGRG